MLNNETIPRQELLKILYDFNLGQISKIKSTATSGNIAYIIQTAKGKYFLRLSPDGDRSRSKQELLAEIELLEFLNKHRFPIYLPLRSRDGKSLISWKNHHGYIRKYSSGQEKTNPTLKDIQVFGETLGKFHKLIKGYKTINKREHTWELTGFKKYFSMKKNTVLSSDFKDKKRYIEVFSQELSHLNFPNQLPSGMIHEDLGKRHVLWNGNKIDALIDFDRTYYGKIVLDLGQAIRGWCFTTNHKNWSNENLQALLKGYQKYYTLTPLEKKYLIKAIKYAVLERSFAFCLRSILLTKDETEADYARHSLFVMINKLEQNLKTIEKIIAPPHHSEKRGN